MRARDLGAIIGNQSTGMHNAITDVAGVRVGYTTLIEGDGSRSVRTGVTVIVPHGGRINTLRCTPDITGSTATVR